MDPLPTGSPPAQPLPPASPPAVWPPPPTGAPYGQVEQVNTSGMKGDVPPEIARLGWNWGACFLPFLWSVTHNLKWGVVSLVPLLLLMVPGITGDLSIIATVPFSLYFGLMGHRLGWQNRRFDGGVVQYLEVQRKWAWGAAIYFASIIVCTIIRVAPYIHKPGLVH